MATENIPETIPDVPDVAEQSAMMLATGPYGMAFAGLALWLYGYGAGVKDNIDMAIARLDRFYGRQSPALRASEAPAFEAIERPDQFAKPEYFAFEVAARAAKQRHAGSGEPA
ncbi:MAG TPA: hypothetical protein VFH39_02770 [Candidatus Saccharimonadales bacterium]|nr:hypothetical protein [Candidatus Saccharimonadales bacterium]